MCVICECLHSAEAICGFPAEPVTEQHDSKKMRRRTWEDAPLVALTRDLSTSLVTAPEHDESHARADRNSITMASSAVRLAGCGDRGRSVHTDTTRSLAISQRPVQNARSGSHGTVCERKSWQATGHGDDRAQIAGQRDIRHS